MMWRRLFHSSTPASELEVRIGYTFKDRALLEMALTLPSFRMESQGASPDNQRLEFLGGAVLGFVSAQLLYEAYPDVDEGSLTVLRSQMASGRNLAAVARTLNMSGSLRIGRGEERQIGREREGALCDALEAVFGALWLDGGLQAVREAVIRLIGIPPPDVQGEEPENPKGVLQEYVQQHKLPLPDYTVVEITGPTHAPVFHVRARCAGVEAHAEGSSKRVAERSAATQLIEKLTAQNAD